MGAIHLSRHSSASPITMSCGHSPVYGYPPGAVIRAGRLGNRAIMLPAANRAPHLAKGSPIMPVPDACATLRFSTEGMPKERRAQAVRELHLHERTLLSARLEPRDTTLHSQALRERRPHLLVICARPAPVARAPHSEQPTLCRSQHQLGGV